jgi:ATP-dependent Clp protease ATP-binding subunit ClpC
MSQSESTRETPAGDAAQLLEGADRVRAQYGHSFLGTYHWLLALLEAGPDALPLGATPLPPATRQNLAARLARGAIGEPLPRETALRCAREHEGADAEAPVSARALARVVLEAAGLAVRPARPEPGDASGPTPRSERSRDVSPTATQPTPALDRFGLDLTRRATNASTADVVARDTEIDLVIETLCRRTKRNPVLLGPAGVGKTAIVEAVARRVAHGEVPDMLRGARVVALDVASLIAGGGVVGEVEKRVSAIVHEASQDGLVLFIDEVHAIVNSGGIRGANDIASLLKPALARGEIACIACTTDDEYRQFIEPDPALERRFQPVRVQELSAAQTLKVLEAVRVEFERLRNVRVPDAVLHVLVDMADRYLRHRCFPDKAIDLLEQCVAHAVVRGRSTVTEADAGVVVRRMLGMPLEIDARVASLQEGLAATGLLEPRDAAALINRLSVSLRGLDLCPQRPSAVVLLTGDAAAQADKLVALIAESLMGAANRVVAIDFARLLQPHDVTLLTGAPPGYVGYGGALTIHRVAQLPWCVIRCNGIDACHPAFRCMLADWIRDGVIEDACGKRIAISDTVVVMTADARPPVRQRMGFAPATEASFCPDVDTTEILGQSLAPLCDVVCARSSGSPAAGHTNGETLFTAIARRYERLGIELRWQDGVPARMYGSRTASARTHDWERRVAERVGQAAIPYLPSVQERTSVVLVIGSDDGEHFSVVESHRSG